MITVLKMTPLTASLPQRVTVSTTNNPSSLSFRHRTLKYNIINASLRFISTPSSFRFVKFVSFASQEAQSETGITDEEIEDSPDGAEGIEDSSNGREETATSEEVVDAEKTLSSLILASLQSYKEALESENECKIAEVEAFLKSLEDEKVDLEGKVTSLTAELSAEKVRVLRIGGDFENFRKRTDRERLSLVTNAQGEVIEILLPVLDNFERAKAQIKVETEGEEKISNSYQSIYKQFMEILGALGVVPVKQVGNAFDPLARYQVGLKFSLLYNGVFRKLDRVFSGFMKSWIRF